MVSKIIAFIVSILCYAPWFYIGNFQKDSEEPISFWSGDTSLKDKVKDIKGYNKEMAALYRKFSWMYLAAIFLSLFDAGIAIGLLCAGSLIGIYWLYKSYKKILAKYS